MYPLNHRLLKPKGPLRQLSFDDWNTLVNMVSGLAVEVVTEPTQVGVEPPAQDGHGWKIRVLGGGGLPSNANKSKWMVPTMSADNATATDDPSLWTVDWVRAHA